MNRRDLLEAAIEADPDDEQAWSVYADFLISEGDPRGELVFADEPTSAKHREQVLGPLTGLDAAFELRHGFVNAVKLDWEPGNRALREILAHPSARFLRRIEVSVHSVDPGSSCQALLDSVVAGRPRCLDRLRIGRRSPDGFDAGNLDGIVALARLTDLIVDCHDARLSRPSPALRSLWFLAPVSGSMVHAVATLRWPRLENLAFWFGATDGPTLDDLRGVLDGVRFPSLRQLSLFATPFTNELVGAILCAPILAQLTELDLSDSQLSDEGARLLLAAPQLWQHLAEIRVLGNYLDETIGELRAHKNFIGLDRQRVRL